MRRTFSRKTYFFGDDKTKQIFTLRHKLKVVALIMIQLHMGGSCSTSAYFELSMKECRKLTLTHCNDRGNEPEMLGHV
jgi:hypothetical protein